MKLLKAEKTGEKLTPMMQQYVDIKANYKDYILFYRLGDFYEMFNEDAMVASKELELTLTSRAGTPMCGVPFFRGVYQKADRQRLQGGYLRADYRSCALKGTC